MIHLAYLIARRGEYSQISFEKAKEAAMLEGKISNSKTISDITTHGVNISGNLYFNVTTYIPKGMVSSVTNQNNRIINLTNNECTIRPNLLIDEYDVIANHSALIGSFKDEEIFYMQRLGIDKNTANKLLIEGFLKSKLNNTLSNNFKKYWR